MASVRRNRKVVKVDADRAINAFLLGRAIL